MIRFTFGGMLGVVVVMGAIGCGRGATHPEMVPVTVIISYQGKPVEGAVVLFTPAAAGGTSAQGLTASAGKAVMRTYSDAEGVLPGRYGVAIHRRTQEQEGTTVDTQGEFDFDADPLPAPKTINHLPSRYATADTSGLAIEVELGHPIQETFELYD